MAKLTAKQKALRKEIKEAEEQEARELKAQNKKLYAKGHRYWVVAWVHPKHGGDDVINDMYSSHIHTKKMITDFLKKKGSSVLNDYGQFKLKEDGSSEPINTPE